MSRPAAALSSDLLVRKGAARPLGLEPTERTPYEVALSVRPVAGPSATARGLRGRGAGPALRRVTPRRPVAGLAAGWAVLCARWGLPTVLLLAGLSMVVVVAATGGGAGGTTAAFATGVVTAGRPPGPIPVTWVDYGVVGGATMPAEGR